MSSLADLPELVGFFSYSREDDTDSHGALSALRYRIQGELRGQIGRTAMTFRLWQDKEAIPSGALWETEIKNAVAQSVFFIPIITPTVVASPYCRFELDAFLARENELGRNDLVFPVLYIDVPGLDDSVRRQNYPVLSLIARRQYVDWRQLRHQDVRSTDVSVAVERFCKHIRDAMYKPWLSPEERKEQEEAAALRRTEAQRQREEAEAEARAKEAEALQRAEAVAHSKRDAEEARRTAAVSREESARVPGERNPRVANSEHQSTTAADTTGPTSDITASKRKSPLSLVIGGAAALLLLVGAIVAWSILPHQGPAPTTAPTTAPTAPPKCAPEDTSCLIPRVCMMHDRSDACAYAPVCTAALRAAAARGVPYFAKYLETGHVLWNSHPVGSSPYEQKRCFITFWGPDAKNEFGSDCSGDCLTIYYTWSSDLDNPSVQITNIKR